MVWAKLDDGCVDHPKWSLIEDRYYHECLGLWTEALVWCCKHRTDGLVPFPLPFGRKMNAKRRQSRWELLVNAGLVDRQSNEKGYKMHDFLDYQPSRQKAEKSLEKTRNRVRKHRKKKADVTADVTRYSDEGVTVVKLDPGPTRPDPTVTPSHTDRLKGELAPRARAREDADVVATDPDRERSRMASAVHKRFQEHFMRAVPEATDFPLNPHFQNFLEIGRAARGFDGEWSDVVERALTRFFADEWAQQQTFPPKALLTNFHKFARASAPLTDEQARLLRDFDMRGRS